MYLFSALKIEKNKLIHIRTDINDEEQRMAFNKNTISLR